MRVPRTRRAAEDLFEIWDYIAGDNVDAADRMVRKIEDIFTSLYESPMMGRDRSEDLSVPGLRSFPLDEYSIFYYPQAAEGVLIVRVWHSAKRIRADLLVE